jgi:hypothetical protein
MPTLCIYPKSKNQFLDPKSKKALGYSLKTIMGKLSKLKTNKEFRRGNIRTQLMKVMLNPGKPLSKKYRTFTNPTFNM